MKRPPDTLQDVTTEWLTSALRKRGGDFSVTGFEITQTIDGTGTKVRLNLTYDRPVDLPAVMWLKSGFGGAHLENALSMGYYALEAACYDDILPRVGIRAPRCFAAEYDLTSGQGAILIEDISSPDYSFPGFETPLSVDLVADGLSELAKLHGGAWNQPWLSRYSLHPIIAPGSAMERYFRITNDVVSIGRYLDGPVGEVVPAAVRDPQRILDMFWALQPHYQQGPAVLLHGDTHVGNCYVEQQQRIGFLDWQIIALGPWAHDVAYWIGSSLSVEDRRASERDLLKHYFTELAAQGVEFCQWDQAWLEYRRALAWGFFVWVRTPASMQPLRNVVALGSRFSQAAADHDVFGLLAV